MSRTKSIETMIRKILSYPLLLSILFLACKKKTEERELTTQEKILGKWKVSTIIEEEIISGTAQTNTYNGVADDYIDFREDGKVYYNVSGDLDTFTYRILNDQYLVQDIADTFRISTLTTTNFTEFHQESGSSYRYIENLYK